MGWSVHVVPITQYAAMCVGELACPGPRSNGQWIGPMRDNYQEADEDAWKHLQQHNDNWQRMNEEWENGRA